MCLLESRIAKLGETLAPVIADTRGRVEKKQAQTYEELQAEQEEAEQVTYIGSHWLLGCLFRMKRLSEAQMGDRNKKWE